MSREYAIGPVTEAEKAKAELKRLRTEFKALSEDCVGYYLEGVGDEIRTILNGGSAERRGES